MVNKDVYIMRPATTDLNSSQNTKKCSQVSGQN